MLREVLVGLAAPEANPLDCGELPASHSLSALSLESARILHMRLLFSPSLLIVDKQHACDCNLEGVAAPRGRNLNGKWHSSLGH